MKITEILLKSNDKKLIWWLYSKFYEYQMMFKPRSRWDTPYLILGIWPLGRHGWLQLLIFDNFFLETNCKFFFFRKLISLLNNLHFIHVILISNNGSKACVQYAVVLITYLKQLILLSNKSMQTLYYLKLLRRKETQWSPCFRQNHTPKYRLKV